MICEIVGSNNGHYIGKQLEKTKDDYMVPKSKRIILLNSKHYNLPQGIAVDVRLEPNTIWKEFAEQGGKIVKPIFGYDVTKAKHKNKLDALVTEINEAYASNIRLKPFANEEQESIIKEYNKYFTEGIGLIKNLIRTESYEKLKVARYLANDAMAYFGDMMIKKHTTSLNVEPKPIWSAFRELKKEIEKYQLKYTKQQVA